MGRHGTVRFGNRPTSICRQGRSHIVTNLDMQNFSNTGVDRVDLTTYLYAFDPTNIY